MAVCSFSIFSIGIFSNRRDQSCRVGRTTGTGIPFGTLGQIMSVGHSLSGNSRNTFQRIDIKETFSIQLHTSQHGIIKCPFHHICILTTDILFQHSGSKKHQSDGCTGFTVGGVSRQIIIYRKRFSDSGGSDAAGHIHSAFGKVFP